MATAACEQCGTEFERKATSNPRRFCSPVCGQRSRFRPAPPKASACAECAKPLPDARLATRIYCSDSCCQKANRRRNAEAIKAGKRRYRQANIERIRARDNARTTEQRRASMQAYYQRKRDEILAYNQTPAAMHRARELARARYARDPSAKRAAALRWAKENPEKAKAIKDRRRARKAGTVSLDFTPEQQAERMAYFGNRCWMCSGEGGHIDHVKPVSRGGWHALCNMRPVCPSCNASKKDQWPIDTRWSLTGGASWASPRQRTIEAITTSDPSVFDRRRRPIPRRDADAAAS